MRIGPQGRVVIPAKYRRALGLEPGDQVVVWLEGDRLVMRSRRAVEEELWALFAEVEGSLADELIQERRRDAEREAQG